jgi:hypothetical protein
VYPPGGVVEESIAERYTRFLLEDSPNFPILFLNVYSLWSNTARVIIQPTSLLA